MYDCIHKAVYVLEQELYEDKTKRLFTYENQSEEMRLNYLFDRIWYVDTCNKIKQLPTEKIQEFINNKSKWNDQIQQLLLTISHIVKNRELNPSDVSYYLDAWRKKGSALIVEAVESEKLEPARSGSRNLWTRWALLAADRSKIFVPESG
jgi:hypothetical protein